MNRFFITAALVMLASPAFAEWTIIENTPDPFNPSKSEFRAAIEQHGDGLGIDCADGAVFLVAKTGPSNARHGDQAHLRIVTDSHPPRDENWSVVGESINNYTTVFFGNEATLKYLNGAQQVSVRYDVGGLSRTSTFDGGTSLTNVIQKALKACGK
jgi:hypothetical protein